MLRCRNKEVKEKLDLHNILAVVLTTYMMVSAPRGLDSTYFLLHTICSGRPSFLDWITSTT